jgi:opacity protein-like surface antigen
MRSLKLALLATAATAAFSSAAFAADLMVEAPTTSAPIIDNSFTWDGAYGGIFLQGQTGPNAFAIGGDLGVQTTMSGILLGGEIEGTVGIPMTASAQITGRVGGVISDSAILYAFSGLGTKSASSFYVPLGAGVEFAVAQNVGLKIEGQYNFDLTSSAQNSAAVKVGVNWHF